jgi:hypothetical protein
MKYYSAGIDNRAQAELFQCLQFGLDRVYNLIQGRRWAAARDGEASFLEMPSNQVHNQVMRIMNAELFYSLIRNNLIYAGKPSKFSYHSAGIFYYTPNELQSWQEILRFAQNDRRFRGKPSDPYFTLPLWFGQCYNTPQMDKSISPRLTESVSGAG